MIREVASIRAESIRREKYHIAGTRFPKALYAVILRRAEENERSVNSEVLYIIKRYLDGQTASTEPTG